MSLYSTRNGLISGRKYLENALRTFFVNLASGELPKYFWTSQQISSFLDIWIVKMRPELFCALWKLRTNKTCLNVRTNSFVKRPEHFGNFARWKHRSCAWSSQQKLRFWTHQSGKCDQDFFCKPCKENFENAFELHSKKPCFGHKNHENAPRSFSVNLANRENFQNVCELHSEYLLFFDAYIVKIRLEPFVNLARWKPWNVSELHSKHFRFWTHKSSKCAQYFFCTPWNRSILKMSLNIFCSSLLYILAVTWERLISWKYVPHIFEKITKLCFVKFSFVKEVVSTFCKCQFSKYVLASIQKKCRKCHGCFSIRGNTVQVVSVSQIYSLYTALLSDSHQIDAWVIRHLGLALWMHLRTRYWGVFTLQETQKICFVHLTYGIVKAGE